MAGSFTGYFYLDIPVGEDTNGNSLAGVLAGQLHYTNVGCNILLARRPTGASPLLVAWPITN